MDIETLKQANALNERINTLTQFKTRLASIYKDEQLIIEQKIYTGETVQINTNRYPESSRMVLRKVDEQDIKSLITHVDTMIDELDQEFRNLI